MNKTFAAGWIAAVLAYACLSGSPARAEEPLATGDSTITRNGVNMALHVPPDLAGAHGPAGIFIFFGGSGDSKEYYQQALAPLGDALGLVVIVPQMPWFKDPGKVQPPGVYRALQGVVDEIQDQFHTDPKWLVIGGASAGGGPSYDLTKDLGAKVALYILASAGPFPDLRTRQLHVVAEKEIEWLGPRGQKGPVLGQGNTDMFAIPGGVHSAQIKHFSVWLPTEMAVMRMEAASDTMRLAEDKLSGGDAAQAQAILKSTLAAAQTLGEATSDEDAFFQYETKHRKELLEKYASTIESLNSLKAKLSSSP